MLQPEPRADAGEQSLKTLKDMTETKSVPNCLNLGRRADTRTLTMLAFLPDCDRDGDVSSLPLGAGDPYATMTAYA